MKDLLPQLWICGWQAIFNCQTPWGLTQLQSGLALSQAFPGSPSSADPQRCGYLGPTGTVLQGPSNARASHGIMAKLCPLPIHMLKA